MSVNTFTEMGTGIYVHPNVKIGKNVKIGHNSCVGYGDPTEGEIVIGDNVTIGAFCIIHFGATLAENVDIDHYCKIGIDVKIGKNTKLLYGKHIYDEAVIGADCIIGGHVADRTIIEDKVTYLGEIAHSHRNARLDWDKTVEPSPVIYKGSVVGVNALIIGGRKIGPCAYIGAGEIVKTDVGEEIALIDGKRKSLSELRGFIKSRCHE
jgi:UDP-3-O-[3-hydroxymyristoyl] glucosamine N-acyltransferase